MPELPEVETIRRGLQSNIVGKLIVSVEVVWSGAVKNEEDEFVALLEKNKIKRIDRVGKLLIIELEKSGKYLLVHLRMTGQLIYVKKEKIVAGGHKLADSDLVLPNKHTRIIISFIDGSKLFFNDLRKFGYWKIATKEEMSLAKNKFGPEPINNDFTISYFKSIFGNRRTNIKAILLNQQMISGIGNIYADEILFRSCVLPDRVADSLNEQEKKRIYDSCKYILQKAIASGGTTFRDYLDHDGGKGSFVDLLCVYGRDKQKCKKCSAIIQKSKVAGRGTHYCKKCQL